MVNLYKDTMANRNAIIEETTSGGHTVLESLARKYDVTVVHVNDGPFEVELKPRTPPNITLDDAVKSGLDIEKNGYKVRRVGSTFKVYGEESLDYLGGFDIEKGTFGFMLNPIENPAFLNLIGNLYGLDSSLLESTDSDGEDRLAPGLIRLDEKIIKTGEGLHEALSREKLSNRVTMSLPWAIMYHSAIDSFPTAWKKLFLENQDTPIDIPSPQRCLENLGKLYSDIWIVQSLETEIYRQSAHSAHTLNEIEEVSSFIRDSIGESTNLAFGYSRNELIQKTSVISSEISYMWELVSSVFIRQGFLDSIIMKMDQTTKNESSQVDTELNKEELVVLFIISNVFTTYLKEYEDRFGIPIGKN